MLKYQVQISFVFFFKIRLIYLGEKKKIDTIRKGIVDVDFYIDKPGVLMVGMFSALIGAFIWLLVATYLKLPVSTTHTTIGAVIGFSLVQVGTAGINWKSVGFIVLSWVVSPIASGLVTACVFLLTRSGILRREKSKILSIIFLPFFFGLTAAIITFSIIYGGTPALQLDKISLGNGIGISIIVGVVVLVIASFTAAPIMYRYIHRDRNHFQKSTPKNKFLFLVCWKPLPTLPVDEERSSENSEIHGDQPEEVDDEKSEMKVEEPEVLSPPASRWQKTKNFLFTKVFIVDESKMEGKKNLTPAPEPTTKWQKFKAVLKKVIFGTEEDVVAAHGESEVFPVEVEETFTAMQVLTACFDSFSHGANDVANAIGPYAAIVAIYNSGSVTQKTAVEGWILGLGGIAIVLGLAMWGYRVIQTLGRKITKITPSRGFAIEFGSATTVVICSKLKLPVSTTQAQVGSVVAIGLADGRKAVNWWVFVNTIVSWMLTLPAAGLMSAMIFAILRAIIF